MVGVKGTTHRKKENADPRERRGQYYGGKELGLCHRRATRTVKQNFPLRQGSGMGWGGGPPILTRSKKP